MRTYSKVIRWGWAIACILIGALRLYGQKDDLFKTIAHLVVFGMFGAWAIALSAERANERVFRANNIRLYPGFYGWAGLGISLVEAYMFVAGRGNMVAS